MKHSKIQGHAPRVSHRDHHFNANLEQVKAGLAWHYKKYQKEQSLDNRSIYAQAEEQARAERRGLWIDA